MKILTIGTSPYILARNGKINSDILRLLKEQGHTIMSAVCLYDEGYFLPNELGIHSYDYKDERICTLEPFIPHPEKSTPQIYEIMKKFQPDLVITIGDYKETDFVYAIKAMYPNLFKWLAILTVDCLWINPSHREALEYADFVVSTSEFGFVDISNLCNVKSKFIPYGPNHDIFKPKTVLKPAFMRVVNIAKNTQSSNIGAFIKAMGKIQDIFSLSEDTLEGILHTNLYDPGDYNLNLLINRYKASNVKLPEKFVSIQDGLTDDEMVDLYSGSHFYVDCSVKSATGLGMLEAMSCGCIPIGLDSGRIGEIISNLPKEFRYYVPYDTYIGTAEEELSIVSINGLVETLMDIKQNIFNSPEKMEEASLESIKVANLFSNKNFLEEISNILAQISLSRSEIALDIF